MQRFSICSGKLDSTQGRALVSGAIALSLAIAGSALSEFALTSPNLPLTQTAIAKDPGVRVAERAGNSVVTLRGKRGYGSGSIIREHGLILTNAHVVKEDPTVSVVLNDGRTLMGDVVAYGADCLDLALVKVRNPGKLRTLDIGRLDRVQQGQQVFAIGSPGLLDNSMTSGIVSRIIPKEGLIQTDASIRPGNSGGPLLNSDGQVIGVNTFIRPAQNAAFAISSDRVQAFLKDFDQGKAPTQPSAITGQSRNIQTVSLPASQIRGELNRRNSGVFCKTGSLFNEYTFQGKFGQTVMISMTSQAFAPALTVYAPDGLSKSDRSYRPGSAATIITSLPRTGTYRVLANSTQPKDAGAYTLNVTPLLFWRSDRLQAGDPLMPDGRPYREYSFNGKAQQTVNIVAVSKQFDIQVCLSDPTGKRLACNDNVSARSTDAGLNFQLPKAGAYKITVAPARRGQGEFSVAVK